MASQKIENLLNLALDATPKEREKSLELDVGYDPAEKTWDLIVKYSGSLEAVRALASSVVELQNEYAVITIRESDIEALTQIPEIEYIEKPKRLFFQVANGRRVSCIDSVQQDTRLSLYGQGILVAIIDSGIEYENADFRNEDGTTRILALGTSLLPPVKGEYRLRDTRLEQSTHPGRSTRRLDDQRWMTDGRSCRARILPGTERRLQE